MDTFLRLEVTTGRGTSMTRALSREDIAAALLCLRPADEVCLTALHGGYDPGLVAVAAVGEEFAGAELSGEVLLWLTFHVLTPRLPDDGQAVLLARCDAALSSGNLRRMIARFLEWHTRCADDLGAVLGIKYRAIREDDLDHTVLRGHDYHLGMWLTGGAPWASSSASTRPTSAACSRAATRLASTV